MLATLRKGFLVYILIVVAAGAWLTQRRVASWERTLWVAIHPINADGSEVSRLHIAALERDAFAPVEEFINGEAKRFGLPLATAVGVSLGAPITEQPPVPPPAGNLLQVMWWSLKLRWWSWRVDRGERPPTAKATVFVRYFDPETSPRLAHSLGLQKGMIGVVNAFASRRQTGSNQVIIVHELLHTLGAGDRYDPRTNEPAWPDGFADPTADPRYPQHRAEIMAGRIPVSPTRSETPHSLADVVVGRLTAGEIGWVELP